MISDQMIPSQKRAGVTARGKLRLAMLAAWPLNSSHAAAAPSRAPGRASIRDSAITETSTAVPPKPMARRVAISRARESTAAYMVLMAPNTAPTAMITPTK